MSRVFVISDLHFGHKSILTFSAGHRFGRTVEEHDQWLITQWNSVVTKRDSVWVLGDVAFGRNSLNKVGSLKGYKFLVPGNHDQYPMEEYAKFFKLKPGIIKYRGFWLSHAPIHPAELRGLRNIHGHVHSHTLPDDRYINVCVEALSGTPVEIEALRTQYTNQP